MITHDYEQSGGQKTSKSDHVICEGLLSVYVSFPTWLCIFNLTWDSYMFLSKDLIYEQNQIK